MDATDKLSLDREVAAFLAYIRAKYGLPPDPILDEVVLDTVSLLISNPRRTP